MEPAIWVPRGAMSEDVVSRVTPAAGVAQAVAVPLVAVKTWLATGIVPGRLIPSNLATVGPVALPLRSPSSWISPGVELVALEAVGAFWLTHLLLPVL